MPQVSDTMLCILGVLGVFIAICVVVVLIRRSDSNSDSGEFIGDLLELVFFLWLFKDD